MRVYSLDSCEHDDTDVRVFIPGPAGPPIVDVGSLAAPALISAGIAAPVNRRQRSFIKGNSGPINNPSIADPGDDGAWELYLFCTDDTDSITLESQSNLFLSGQWIGTKGSILYLQWDGVSQYVEGGRNEI
jgi:hypothetical protein